MLFCIPAFISPKYLSLFILAGSWLCALVVSALMVWKRKDNCFVHLRLFKRLRLTINNLSPSANSVYRSALGLPAAINHFADRNAVLLGAESDGRSTAGCTELKDEMAFKWCCGVSSAF